MRTLYIQRVAKVRSRFKKITKVNKLSYQSAVCTIGFFKISEFWWQEDRNNSNFLLLQKFRLFVVSYDANRTSIKQIMESLWILKTWDSLNFISFFSFAAKIVFSLIVQTALCCHTLLIFLWFFEMWTYEISCMCVSV